MAAPLQAPAKLSEEQLVQLLGPAIDKLVKENLEDSTQFEKNLQYSCLRRAYYYNIGIQNIAPEFNRQTGTMDWTPVGVPISGQGDSAGLLDYNIDQVTSFRRKYVAVIGQRPFFNAKAMPENPSSEDDRQAAKLANLGILMLQGQWNVKYQNLLLAYHQYVNGTSVGLIQFRTDRVKYGIHREPQVKPTPVELSKGGYKCQGCGAMSESLRDDGEITLCPQCFRPLGEGDFQPPEVAMVATEDGFKEYAKGQVELKIVYGSRITIPSYVKDLEDAPVVRDEYEEHKGRLIDLHKILRDKMKGNDDPGNDGSSTSAEQMGQLTRSALTSTTGVIRKQDQNLWTVRKYWFRSWLLELIEDEKLREIAKHYYPDGMMVKKAAGTIVSLVNEAPERRMVPCRPEISENLVANGLCWGILGHQDAINDLYNLALEILERSVPVHVADPDYIDADIWNSQPAMPNEMIQAKAGVGGNLANGFYTLQAARFPDQLEPMAKSIEEAIQTHLGLFPNVYGGGGSKQTAEQARNDLNQALMQLGMHGQMIADFWCGAYKLGLTEFANNAPTAVDVRTADGETEKLDPEVLRKGNYYIESEPGVPRSWGERKDALQQLVQQNPQLTHALGVDDPSNLEVVGDYLDLPELKMPQQDSIDKITEVIEELLKGQPIMPPPMPGPDGMPMPPQQQPSVPFEQFVIDPSLAVLVVKNYLNSKPGRKKFGTPGYANVVAWGLQAQQLSAPPMPEGPPPDGGGGPGGDGGGSPKPEGPKPPSGGGSSKAPPTGSVMLPTGAGAPAMQ